MNSTRIRSRAAGSLAALLLLAGDLSDRGYCAPPVAPIDGVIRLFNGKNLDGLYTWLRDTKYEDPRGVFAVKNGMLHISGDGWGGITTMRAYRDYHLVCEFKWGERTWDDRKDRARDSGVLVHCHGPDGAYGNTWLTSIEAQIIEGGVGDFIVVSGTHPDGSRVEPLSLTAEIAKDRDGESIWNKGGERKTFAGGRVNWYGRDPDWEDELGFRGKQDVESVAGEWTRMDVICDGPRIVIKVNGTVVNEAVEVEPTAGKITIQSELAEILVRRWELWPLGKAPPSKNNNRDLTDRRSAKKNFRAGALAIDISPTNFPVIVNGGMNERIEEKLLDPLHARCLVLDDGSEQLAIVVVDSCMMPRELLDEAKAMAERATGIPVERILISATHTHSAPSVMPCLGSRRDEAYTRFLPGQIAKGIKLAQDRLAPARIGWAMGRDEKNVASRRWLMKPGTLPANPFGVTGESAKMHPGYGNANAIRPTGPVDPDVAVLSVQTRDGRPLALVSNYSMHYVGGPSISADYFALFCDEIGKRIGADGEFVAMLSNGTSGDAWCLDHRKPKRKFDRLSVAQDVARAAFDAYQTIDYYDWVPLVMDERLLRLDVRMPSAEDVVQAEAMLAEAKARQDGKRPTVPEVYAGETIALSQMPPTRELKLQAIRIGDLGITAIPNEVFGGTGLAIKRQSPLAMTFNISLANGSEGYIPPPDQHPLGGYTTWRARTSCLEIGAEPKIARTVVELLRHVASRRNEEKPSSSVSPRPRITGLRPGPSLGETRLLVPVPSPLNADESLSYFHLHDDFRIELVAAEPAVVDPVAYDWGPDGKLWVVEMADYPRGLDGEGQPGGRIRYLQDTNGDGAYDKSTLFATDIPMPNGITVWRDGVIVTKAAEILYLEDSDDDGRADVRKPLYTGLTEGNPQLRVNGLRWGLDGWLYCANGLSSVGEVESVETGKKLTLRGRDMRIRPDEGLLDAQLGITQFGRNRDDWGNWFGVSNSNPMWHFLLADQYLRRNPHLPMPSGLRDVSINPGKADIFARSARGIFFHPTEVDRFTSANSTIVYRDELFGPEFYPNSFVSEPVHNLIHREVMQQEGVTFSSQRAPEEQQSEFLASTDTWFRPNMIRTGPDGALWIADMYREVIDHPAYIPADQHARLDFRKGDKLGRVYRVLPKGRAARSVPRLDGLSDAELAAHLDNPSGTFRDMVQKQIVWGERRGAVPLLEEQAIRSDRATCRMQSLWTLECLGELRPAVILKALDDPHPGVRRGAVRLAEGKFQRAPELGVKLAGMVDDPDPPVRLQLACTLGDWHDARASPALAQLGLQDARVPAIIGAIVSSIRADNVGPVLETVLASTGDPPETLVGKLLVSAVGYDQWEVAAHGLDVVATGPNLVSWQLASLAALSDKLAIGRKSFADLLQADDPHAEALSTKIEQLFETARRLVADRNSPGGIRLLALRLLGHQGKQAAEDRVRLGKLLTLQESGTIQLAAVEALSRLGGDQVPAMLLNGWNSHSPRLRTSIAGALLSRSNWTVALLDKIEAGEVASRELDATQRSSLTNHRDQAIRKRAATLLAGAGNSNRQAVLREWQPTLGLEGDWNRGVAIFAKRCAVCHQLDGEGRSVGPDLAALTDKTAKSLLRAILDPNQAIDARYLNYLALTDEGRIFSGILVQESGASITLTSQDGKDHVLMRESLEEMRCTGLSMMPEGLEKDMTPQELADLIAYVAGPRADTAPTAAKQMHVLASESRPPNFVVIVCDNLGYGDIEPFGSTKHRTPNLNRMAREGRKFTHFCVTAGVCTPSRASLMTGCYAQRVGMHTNPRDGNVLRPISPYGLHPDEITIAEVLQQRGYATAAMGKWHLGDQSPFLPTRQGFDSFFGLPYSDDMTAEVGQRLGLRYNGRNWPPLPLMENEKVVEAPVDRNLLTRRLTERALTFIEQHQDGPFFLYFPQAMPGSTSAPFASPGFQGLSRNGPWGDAIEELDWSTGKLLDKLVELGLAEQTLVVWTSDNGAPMTPDTNSSARGSNGPLHGRGYTTSEGAFRVPTIMWWPGKVEAGSTCGELATTMDLLPTFARLAGGLETQEPATDGHDIRPLIFDSPNAKSPYDAFYYYAADQLQAVRSGPWKLFLPLESFGRHPHFAPGNRAIVLLFNVVEDVGSQRNMADEYPEIVTRLTRRAEAARADLGDVGRPGRGQRVAGYLPDPKRQEK